MERQLTLERQQSDVRDWDISKLFRLMFTPELPKEIYLNETPAMSLIDNQLNLGSCGTNALTSIMEFNDGEGGQEYSRLDLYYHTRKNMGTLGEDSGVNNRSMLSVCNKDGVCSETDWAYDITKFKVEPPVNVQRWKINSYYAITSNILNTIDRTIALLGTPVLMGMDCYSSILSEDIAKTGILKMPYVGEKSQGGHDVVIVGYKPGYKLVRNSWGTNWGVGGYFWMPNEYIEKDYAWDFWVAKGVTKI